MQPEKYMKIITAQEALQKQLTCDECNEEIDSDAVLIGEHSWDFEEDTRQSTLCLSCLQMALKSLQK